MSGEFGMQSAERNMNPEVKAALEAAHHELTTLNGLLAADAVSPAETWTIDTTNLLKQLDAVIEPS